MAIFVCISTTAAAQDEEAFAKKVADLRQTLVDVPCSGLASLLPELQTAKVADLAGTRTGAALLTWGKEALQEPLLPETTYTLYRQFKRNGERATYQRPHSRKRALLTQEVLNWWLGGDASRLDRINDLLWSICEESSWVLPAHEKDEGTIDLADAETAANLAHAITLMDDALPEEVSNRVRQEIRRRIFDNFLDHGRGFWWNVGRNNWTGVCSGCIGQCFLLLEPDVERQARGLALVMEQLDRFVEHAFESDGGCLEGIGYWNYGLIHYVEFAEMLRTRTAGRIDLLARDKLKAIAQYPLAVWLGGHTFASFSDAHETADVIPFLGARLAQRTGATSLLQLAGDPIEGSVGGVLRNLLWWDGNVPAPGQVVDILLPVSGVARMVAPGDGRQLVLAAKAGHNGEPHNHNDVGSFIVCVDEEVLLCDPGSGLYNRDYFSNRRYENAFANSYGHSVPRIGGKLQTTGADRRGTMERTGDKSLSIEFSKTYDIPELQRATRAFALEPDAVSMRDQFTFTGAGMEVEEALMTWKPVEIEGAIARIKGEKATLEIVAEQGTFAAELLEEACNANQKPATLTRLTVTYPAAPAPVASFRFIVK